MAEFQNTENRTDRPNINTYLWQSIVVTTFCCVLFGIISAPLGIIAIMFANKATKKLTIRDYQGALVAAKRAKLFTWAAFALGIVQAIFYAYLIIGVNSAFS